MGLMGVVSLPRPFVFRMNMDDPHPVPWLRVILSCAMGQAMYPHPQWRRLAQLWESYYPLAGLPASQRLLLDQLRQSMPGLIGLMLNHRPAALRGRSLVEVMQVRQRQPATLSRLFHLWSRAPALMYRAPPTLVFAVLGQARANGGLMPEEESALLSRLLMHWALRSTIDTAVICSDAARHRRLAAPARSAGSTES
jgi:hypothetical protein